MSDLVAWLNACYDRAEQAARDAGGRSWGREAYGCVVDADNGLIVYSEGTPSREQADHIARHDPASVLREVEAKREILAEHAPQWRTVEWDHDQNGRGEALCCPRCQNAEHSEWSPPWGHAVGLPEGFVTPYVLAPCRTLRLLAAGFAGELGYDVERWAP